MSALLDVRVADAQLITPVIREIRLEPLAGSLPGFSAGSHVLVHLPTPQRSLRNAYSLLGDPAEPALDVRLQEMFGAADSPAVARGRGVVDLQFRHLSRGGGGGERHGAQARTADLVDGIGGACRRDAGMDGGLTHGALALRCGDGF